MWKSVDLFSPSQWFYQIFSLNPFECKKWSSQLSSRASLPVLLFEPNSTQSSFTVALTMDRIRHIYLLLLLGVLAISQAEEQHRRKRMVSIFNIVKVSPFPLQNPNPLYSFLHFLTVQKWPLWGRWWQIRNLLHRRRMYWSQRNRIRILRGRIWSLLRLYRRLRLGQKRKLHLFPIHRYARRRL